MDDIARKVYVDMLVEFSGGKIIPKKVKWEDGRIFEIDKITDIRPAPSYRAGGIGTRYTVMIKGSEHYIWLEEDKWFVEGKR